MREENPILILGHDNIRLVGHDNEYTTTTTITIFSSFFFFFFLFFLYYQLSVTVIRCSPRS